MYILFKYITIKAKKNIVSPYRHFKKRTVLQKNTFHYLVYNYI